MSGVGSNAWDSMALDLLVRTQAVTWREICKERSIQGRVGNGSTLGSLTNDANRTCEIESEAPGELQVDTSLSLLSRDLLQASINETLRADGTYPVLIPYHRLSRFPEIGYHHHSLHDTNRKSRKLSRCRRTFEDFV